LPTLVGFARAARGQRCGKLWPTVEGISALPRLSLDELSRQVEAFALSPHSPQQMKKAA